MSTKYTPWPWVFGWSNADGLTGPRCAPTVFLDKADVAIDIPVHRNGQPIAWVLSSLPDERAEPDARLIASAPELLEALQRLQACYSSSHSPSVRESCWLQARAAILKATGEQQ